MVTQKPVPNHGTCILSLNYAVHVTDGDLCLGPCLEALNLHLHLRLETFLGTHLCLLVDLEQPHQYLYRMMATSS